MQERDSTKRILYITAAFPWPQSESFLIPEINTLAKAGDQLIVVPTRLIQTPVALPDEMHHTVSLHAVALFKPACLKAFAKLLYARPKFISQLIIRLFGSGFKKGLKNLLVLPKAAYFAQLIRETPIDHIHAHWAGVSGSLAFEIAEISGVSFSITAHRWDVSENNLLPLKSQHASFMRFISEKERQLAISLGARERTAVRIPMGVTTGGASARTFPKKPVTWQLICIASFLEVKGHEFLFRAFETLLSKKIDVHLTLVGDGPLKQRLETRYAHLSGNLTFKGNLKHAVVMDQLASGHFHIGVLSSVTDRHGEHEGVPVCLMEMMSAGMPVVATQTGSIHELLPEHLLLTAPEKDANALAERIEKLITQPAHYETAAAELLAVVNTRYNSELNTLTLRSHIHSS